MPPGRWSIYCEEKKCIYDCSIHGWWWLFICLFHSHSAEILPIPLQGGWARETGHPKSLKMTVTNHSLRPPRLDKNVPASRTSSVMAIRAVEPSTGGSGRHGQCWGAMGFQACVGRSNAEEQPLKNPPEGPTLRRKGCQIQSHEVNRHKCPCIHYPHGCQDCCSSEKQGLHKEGDGALGSYGNRCSYCLCFSKKHFVSAIRVARVSLYVSPIRLDSWELRDHCVSNLPYCFPYVYPQSIYPKCVFIRVIELNDEPGRTLCNKEGSFKIRPNDNSQRLTPKRRIYTNCSSAPGPDIEARSLR